MFTFSNRKECFVNLDEIVSIFIGKTGDKIVGTDRSGKNWNIAFYENIEQCRIALLNLKNGMLENKAVYEMPSVEYVRKAIEIAHRDQKNRSLKGKKVHGHGKS